jgi:hypothetical protein
MLGGMARLPREGREAQGRPDPIAVPRLPVATVDVVLRAAERVELPGWLGSTLHGAIGGALRRLVCSDACAARHAARPCAYALLFDRPRCRGPASGRLAATAAHPLALRPPPPGPDRLLLPGETVAFGVSLLGPAAEVVGLLVTAIEEAARSGLGRRRGRLDLGHVSSARSTLGAGAAGGRQPLVVRAVTPLRLYRRRELIVRPSLADLVLAAARRLEALDAYFGAGEACYDEELLRVAAGRLRPRGQVWRAFRVLRFSSRQGRRHPMEGVVGEASWDGDAAELRFLLEAAATTGLGKATSFGFGLISLTAATAPEPEQDGDAVERGLV